MENPDDDDDLELVRASASLLSDLESSLPRLLWKKPVSASTKYGTVHKLVKRKQLTNVVDLIEPFQGEPQLLDARLKIIVPDIVAAFLQSLPVSLPSPGPDHVGLQVAACQLLYTLCKVRGQKIIVGFLSNEPRYLEPILETLERSLGHEAATRSEWQLHYILLLWLGHLLLTPFDLESISDTPAKPQVLKDFKHFQPVPQIVARILNVGLQYLPASTKAQDAAAAMLTRLVGRPDMRRLELADPLVQKELPLLDDAMGDATASTYERLGVLKLVAGIATSTDLSYLTPSIYRACYKLAETEDTDNTLANAVAKKIYVKVFRNTAILSLRTAYVKGPLLSFFQSTSVLEDVIDALLQSLGDRDTPVRYAAAKALSIVVQELDPEMGHEVVQAVLDTLNEDLPRKSGNLNFSTVNALKWHGLTLTLGHALFKRTASPAQLPDIVNALFSALQFEQRAATGSSIGTNVRDAANFGIWSLSRRYTTAELKKVDSTSLRFDVNKTQTVIVTLAIQLLLAACLDPAGNIRRGSSAALQELIGRHPDEVPEGIALVQTVDFQAVGLRRRAMVAVAENAARLHNTYRDALLQAVFGWRGIGSPDVPSREAAAEAIALLTVPRGDLLYHESLHKVFARSVEASANDAEALHGLSTTLACLLDKAPVTASLATTEAASFTKLFSKLVVATADISPRVLRSELLSAAALAIAAICRCFAGSAVHHPELCAAVNTLTERILIRHETAILSTVPTLVRSLRAAQQSSGNLFEAINAAHLQKQVLTDGARWISHGAGRALALGVLASNANGILAGDLATSVVHTLAGLNDSRNVAWRTFGLRGLQLAVEIGSTGSVDPMIAATICHTLTRGMNDYSIDERGDVGSFVRLQAISCAMSLLSSKAVDQNDAALGSVRQGVIRLSLEKLDRVRHQAAVCRQKFLDLPGPVTDIGSISDYDYFVRALSPLDERSQDSSTGSAVFEGCISCSGAGSESLMQCSRHALADILDSAPLQHLQELMTAFATTLQKLLTDNVNLHPALELLGFLLDTQILQRLAASDFKWRNLLSTVQKSHHKSNDIPKIMAAVHVYQGLADIPKIRTETTKKLFSMLKTNPYPRVRNSVAEVLWILAEDEGLKSRDWSQPLSKNLGVIEALQEQRLRV